MPVRLASTLKLSLFAACLVFSGCAQRSSESLKTHAGPVVVITIDTLRADVVGALSGDREGPSLTPHLDQLIEDSDWASTAVAASSWTVPSMASIVTGRQPWSHGNIHGERAILAEEQLTLAEVFQRAGYRTTGFRSNVWLRPKFGYAQGFDAYHSLGGRKRAVAVLESLGVAAPSADVKAEREPGQPVQAKAEQTLGRDFVWLHVLPPHAPYVRHSQFAERLGDAELGELPARVTAAQLEPFLDPAVELSDDQRERFWSLYRLHVAHADEIVGELLDAIRRSGSWDDTLIAVTSDHGEEFGEEGQIAHGGNLNRVLIEVPMVIKLPASLRSGSGSSGADRALQAQRLGISNVRLFATLAEAIGQSVEAGVLPSLWSSPGGAESEDDGGPALPALSELYLGNGDNRYSLVEADGSGGLNQVHWASRFAAPEPEYYAARKLKADQLLPSGESAADLWQRQARAFDTSLPLRGALGKPEVTERSWSTGGSSAAESAAARRLEREWLSWNGIEEPPIVRFGEAGDTEFTDEERSRLEKLGYVVAAVSGPVVR